MLGYMAKSDIRYHTKRFKMIKINTVLIFFSSILGLMSPSFGLADKKDDFINQLLPSISAINTEITNQRQHLLQLYNKHKTLALSPVDRHWLFKLAAEYKITQPDFKFEKTWIELKKKVDIIPPTLAIAQAATESGWGSSRYARLANNYFGQSCFKVGCGMKPKTKKSWPYYEAASFHSVDDAVRSYINNLNTHTAYKELRQIRHQQRQKNQPPKSILLVKGLQHYSELGNAYVQYISNMIKKLQRNYPVNPSFGSTIELLTYSF